MPDFTRRLTVFSLREKAILTFNIARPKPRSVLNASARCPDSKMFRTHLQNSQTDRDFETF